MVIPTGEGTEEGKRGGEGHIKSLLWTMTDDPLCFCSDPVMDLKRRAPQNSEAEDGVCTGLLLLGLDDKLPPHKDSADLSSG